MQRQFNHRLSLQGELEIALSSIMYTEEEWRVGAHRGAERGLQRS